MSQTQDGACIWQALAVYIPLHLWGEGSVHTGVTGPLRCHWAPRPTSAVKDLFGPRLSGLNDAYLPEVHIQASMWPTKTASSRPKEDETLRYPVSSNSAPFKTRESTVSYPGQISNRCQTFAGELPTPRDLIEEEVADLYERLHFIGKTLITGSVQARVWFQLSPVYHT
jgi:hypothetical protein